MLATIIFINRSELMGDVVNIMLADFTFPGPFFFGVSNLGGSTWESSQLNFFHSAPV